MPICTVERKRVGESANFSAARAPLSPASARSLRRALREETSAVSDMAKRPLKRVRTTMTAICNPTPSIRGSCTRGARFPNPSYSPECVERLYEKPSNTGEPPRHEANHGSIHERFSARTRPLVVFAHPPVVVDPSYSPLHYPPPRQHQEAFGGQQLLPIYGHALFGPFPGPPHQHLFGGGPFRTLDEIHRPPQGLLDPVRALALSAVARVQPQLTEARKPLVRFPQ